MKVTRNTRPRVRGQAGFGWRLSAAILAVTVFALPSSGSSEPAPIIVVSAPQGSEGSSGDAKTKLTPEQTMARRFPQQVKVGFLIGLPVLDDQDSTIGYIQQVTRTPEGKVQLIVPYGRWFGWVRNGGVLDRWRRPVPVPIEAVAILARHVNALDMPRHDFDTTATFQPGSATALRPAEIIRMAVGRR